MAPPAWALCQSLRCEGQTKRCSVNSRCGAAQPSQCQRDSNNNNNNNNNCTRSYSYGKRGLVGQYSQALRDAASALPELVGLVRTDNI